MKNRVPVYPNRYAIYDESHNFLRYEYHERADAPAAGDEGTVLDKGNILPDATCTLLGIPITSVPKDAFNKIAGQLGLVPLMNLTVGTAAPSINLDLSGIDTSLYMAIEVYATVFTSATGPVNCTVNNLTSGYSGSYIASANTSVQSVNNAVNFGNFAAGTTDATYATPAVIKLSIEYSRPYPVAVTYNRRYINIEYSGGQAGSSMNKIGHVSVQDGASQSSVLSSIQFAAANIMPGTIFEVYGVKK